MVEFNSVQVFRANEFIAEVRQELRVVEKSFFTIGYKLNEAERAGDYKALGYSDIYELAEKEFNIGKTTTKNLKMISMQFKDADEPTRIATKYQDFNQSQLVEMTALNPSEYDIVDVDFTRDDIRDLKKVLAYCYTKESQEVFGRNFDLTPAQVRGNPKLYIEKLRQWKKKCPNGKKKAEPEQLDGQLCLTDEGDVTEYHQEGANLSQRADRKHSPYLTMSLDEILEQADATEPAETFADEDDEEEPKEFYQTPRIEVVNAKIYPRTLEVIKELSPKLHKFKNTKERQAFIEDENNFTEFVFENAETGLKVMRLDFANGAKLYRITWQEFSSWRNEFVERSRLCLVANSEEKDANGMTFSTKSFDINGTAPTYVINYMTKHSGEI